MDEDAKKLQVMDKYCKQFVRDNLQEMCRELVHHTDTAVIIKDGLMETLAHYIVRSFGSHYMHYHVALRMVKSLIEYEAVTACARDKK